jgi:hypothetical protein
LIGGRGMMTVVTIAGAYKVHKKEYEETKLIGDTLVPKKEAVKFLIDITKSNIRQVEL